MHLIQQSRGNDVIPRNIIEMMAKQNHLYLNEHQMDCLMRLVDHIEEYVLEAAIEQHGWVTNHNLNDVFRNGMLLGAEIERDECSKECELELARWPFDANVIKACRLISDAIKARRKNV